MKLDSGRLRLSASDLSNYLACNHLTSLDMAVANEEKAAPEWRSPDAWVLQERGIEHEKSYLSHLQDSGLTIVNCREFNDERALSETRQAMRSGADVIVQGSLANGRWFGRSDVLRRVERPSALGTWSYEVYDCKLSRETKAATILQLSLYSELLASVQGILPEWMYVVTPAEDFRPEPHRVLDFAAYYRYVQAQLEAAVESNGNRHLTYAEPNSNCPVCRWWPACEKMWRDNDHLSLVAGISKLQRKQLNLWEIGTVEQLAKLALPLRNRPEHGSKDSYVHIREQARVQVAGRTERRPVHELLEIAEGRGLSLLPAPSPGDVFFDLESDPFVGLGDREYLFGFVTEKESGKLVYERRWAITPQEEKQAFEWLVDSVMERWRDFPGMHIYHFTPYEPSALKRLMGRYGTREEELDRMLRACLFIDLHSISKQAVRASVEQYSLKALEIFHGFERTVPLEKARQALRRFEHSLELEREIDANDFRSTIEGYNADDCHSTRSLRIWLERQRQTLEQGGTNIQRPVLSDGAPSEDMSERQQQIAALVSSLTKDVSEDSQQRTEEQGGRWLLANLLEWHRRENKADCWEFFRLRDLTNEELFEERAALSGLHFVQRVSVKRNIPVDRYTFDRQETEIRPGKIVCHRGEHIGEVVAINLADRTIDIKKAGKTADIHPSSVFVDDRGPGSGPLAQALLRIGSWVNANGMDSPGPYRAARDLLLRRAPRLSGADGVQSYTCESTLDAAKRIVLSLADSVLAIQGPPGAGKTYTAARMICELIRQGKKVGVTAGSHKVIRNLLDEVLRAARELGLGNVTCVQKVSDKAEADGTDGIEVTTKNEYALAALKDGTARIVGGTPWVWSREDFFEALDVLFVDEAGQMSLANALAVAQSAKSLVLLGDPQQLEQPLRGSHREGADASALEHLLAGAKTIPSDKGLFLDKTWRLHPKICAFTSEVFYENRLQSRKGLERQGIEGHPWLGTAGLWFVPVLHKGNKNSSPEEVDRIAGIVEGLLRPGVEWIDDKGKRRPLTMDDILIVAPYNAQVSDLSSRLSNARVGTVDKFQGQEAPVVIYSLTTSSPEDAPRGMEFLYSLNRLNVATSRARALAILIGSPDLLRPECRTPRQMQLANAFCRYAELAHILEFSSRAA
jgi:predicted RecB family nuclease